MKKKISEIKKAVKAFPFHVIKVDRCNEIVAVIHRSKASLLDYSPGFAFTVYITGSQDSDLGEVENA